MPKVCGVHSVAKVFIAVGLDDDIGDFGSLGLLRRADAVPTIDEFVVLVDLNRRQRVEDIRVLLDQVVVALTEPGIQVVAEYDVVERRSFVGCP